MASTSHIEWTDATWNPVTGCSVVSPGCTNCYAMQLAGTRLKHHPSRAGLTTPSKAGPVWNGQVRLNEQWLRQPLDWKTPRRIFVCAHGDLFAPGVPDEWIDRVFAVMALAPQHTFQVLTKRPERMRAYLSDPRVVRRIYELVCDRVVEEQLPVILRAPGIADPGLRSDWPRIHLEAWPLPNVWLGVSAEDQARADERVPLLLDTPAAIRFVSAEPLLGPIDFNDIPWPKDRPRFPETDDISDGRTALRMIEGTRLDWIIVGGESGPGARPMHPAWARSIRDQCAAATRGVEATGRQGQDEGVPFFFKQWGAWAQVYDRQAEDPDWRRCGTVERETPNGQWLNLAGGTGFHGEHLIRVDRVGKKRAGRRLDGVEHNGMPEIREVPFS